MVINDLEIVSITNNGKEIKLFRSDIGFIQYIRSLGYGRLSDVEIHDGRVVLMKKCEKKIKPLDQEC